MIPSIKGPSLVLPQTPHQNGAWIKFQTEPTASYNWLSVELTRNLTSRIFASYLPFTRRLWFLGCDSWFQPDHEAFDSTRALHASPQSFNPFKLTPSPQFRPVPSIVAAKHGRPESYSSHGMRIGQANKVDETQPSNGSKQTRRTDLRLSLSESETLFWKRRCDVRIQIQIITNFLIGHEGSRSE